MDWLQHDGTVAEGPREGTTEGGGERAYLGLDPDGDGDGGRVWSHCRFVPPLIHFITDSLRESVPLFLKRQCDRTLDGGHPYAHGRPCTPTRTTECCGDGVCDGPESHANCPGECAPGAVAWSTPPSCADVVSDATENCKCADGVDNDGAAPRPARPPDQISKRLLSKKFNTAVVKLHGLPAMRPTAR